MALALEVPNLESIPEAFRSEYTENNGVYRLNVDGVDEIVKKSVKELNAENAKRRHELAELQKRYEGIDPAEVLKLKQERDAAEEEKLKSEGRIAELAEKRAEKAIAAERKRAEELTAQRDLEQKRADSFRDRVLDNHIRAAAAGVLHKSAIEDALLYARQIFSLDDEGNAVQFDGEKQVKLGKDGKTPFSPTEWLDELKDSRPHWFPATNNGGGSMGGHGASSGSKSMARDAFFRMLPADQGKFMKDGGQLTD